MKIYSKPSAQWFFSPRSLIKMVFIPSFFALSPLALGLTITEDFTRAQTSNNWLFPTISGYGEGGGNIACLTAGNGVNVGSNASAGSPPACTYQNFKEQPGQGALRLTDYRTFQAGGIVSNFTFPSNEGVEISFVTYSFGGNYFQTKGADGMAFFLMDGNRPAAMGGFGGQLGYGGLPGAYLGVGIDEYGNFAYYGGVGGQDGTPNAIVLRGSQSTNWRVLPGGIERLSRPIVTVHNTNSRQNATPITYKLKITSNGLLSLWWSYNGGEFQPVMVDRDISASNGIMPPLFRFGFSGSTGAGSNNHDVLCFKATPAAISDNSAAINLPEAEFKTEAQIYVTTYSPINWWSSLASQNITYNTTTGVVAVNPQANWDASCNLTGGVCNKTGGNTVPAQSPSSRTIITYNGTNGNAFKWPSLDTTQQGLLNAVDNNGELRLDYLRGERSEELKTDGSGKFRRRTGVLGDIINNSSPAWVGPPTDYTKPTVWADKLTGQSMPENADTVQTYANFKTLYNNRVNVLYVGANDGFLHGFRTGAYDSTGEKYEETADKPNDGKELLAYMPASVLKRIHHNTKSALDFSSPSYAHNYFNDATPGTGDLFYGGKWHTWLVSGLGSGGAAIYALDVTDPEGTHESNKKFTESNANKLVVGEWSYNAEDAVWKHLGNTHGKPEIVRFHNGQWGAVFGNGWCDANDASNGNCSSPTGKAGIYLMLLDEANGTPSFKFLDTGVGTSASPNGVAQVTPVDFDEDNIVDYVYAGDLQGNIWRFDLTATDTSDWGKSDSLIKLFSTPAGQPITSKLSVGYTKKKNASTIPRVMVNFGTGRKINGYLVSSDSYSTTTQSMYGIWDPNFSSWNSQSAQKFIQYADASPVSKSMLTTQSVNATTNKMSNNEVCWAEKPSCSATKQFGWYMDFSSPEQVIYSPVLSVETGAILVNSFIPGREHATSCEVPTPSGFTYAFDFESGKGKKGYWDGKFNEDGYRLLLGATGSPTLMKVNGKWIMLTKNSKGDITPTRIFTPPEGTAVKRLSWRIIS